MNVKRGFIAFATILCITLNVAGVFLYKKHIQVAESSGWVSHTYQVISNIQSSYGNLEKMVAVQRGFLMTGNVKYLERYDEAAQEMETALATTLGLVKDNPRQLEHLTTLKNLIVQLKEVLEVKIKMQRQGNPIKVDIKDDIDSVKAVADQVRDLSGKMLDEEDKLLNERLAEEKRTEQNYSNAIILASLVSVIVILAGNGVMLGMIARQRRTENELEVARERLELALTGTNDGIFDWHVKNAEIFLSPRFREMLGYTKEELPGTVDAFSNIVHPDDLAMMQDYMARFLSGEIKDYRNVFRLRQKNGSWVWHFVRAVAIYDDDGKPERLVGAHTDITEQKAMEERIKASNKELEEFTYIASHDLRSPLVNLKGFAGEIEHILKFLTPFVKKALPLLPGENTEEIRLAIEQDLPQAVGFIKTSVTRMDRLTQSILELSRLGRRELKFEEVDTAKLVEANLESLGHQIIEKHVDVAVGDLPKVLADPLALEQIFGNIIDNAIKYLDPKRPGKISISGRRGASETVFEISDNGRGIAADDMKKIFEIFKRAGNNTDIPGEGMGMPYIQATIRRHGGNIWCRSELGVGTIFYFTIPNRIAQEKANV